MKRNQFKTFEKAKIEINEASEWSLISFGLKKLLEDAVESINFYEKLQNEYKEDRSNDIKYFAERKSQLEEMLNVLNCENERVWK
ncbi:hypothetical protein [Fredinandcohnia sp. 179-A 10B2 NHS]|uniref:hypothetical protein n=1 Tax=Fredinandcohnia sp. 179-A 10B2 NHS TaxID=3235176 RepID=UPI0039A28902